MYQLGIIGGGQLAKMLALSAARLGYDVAVLEKPEATPCVGIPAMIYRADWHDQQAVVDFARKVDVVTLENEFVDIESLEAIEQSGLALYPKSATLKKIQDKFIQKQTLANTGIPVMPFAAVATPAELEQYVDLWGLPLVLKRRCYGYDGKGNAVLHSRSDIDAAWHKLEYPAGGLYVEQFCPFLAELAIIVVRARDGEVVCYPVVESVQKDHVCHIIRAPAGFEARLTETVQGMAESAVTAVDAVGAVGIEFFLTREGTVILNEMAPRVHNSGHYTIEACASSQFENHLRAVLGLPLGSTKMYAPATVMINLFGASDGGLHPHGMDKLLSIADVHLHCYGKTARKGRKMGHVTVLAETIEEAEEKARVATDSIYFGSL